MHRPKSVVIIDVAWRAAYINTRVGACMSVYHAMVFEQKL
jgi:hypothetical protein